MRFIYFIYFILKADYKKVWQSVRCQKKHYNTLRLILDSLWCAFYYGTSLNDYFNFRFFEKKHDERNSFASTLFMYKFHKALNHKEFISKIDNKIQFREYYNAFTGPSMVFDVRKSNEISLMIEWLKKNDYTEIVVKDPLGTTGKSVKFFTFQKDSETFEINGVEYSKITFCKNYSIKGQIYIEPRLKQHSLIHELSPKGLNTIRIITVVTKDHKVDIVAAVFRIAINSKIDNFSAGNIAAAIDPLTGKVICPGRKKMAACSDLYFIHPLSRKPIVGFLIPHWDKVVDIAKKAALIIPEVRTVGWDIAVLEDRVVIIEGNSKWNKDTPQIPLSIGIKPMLEKYLF